MYWAKSAKRQNRKQTNWYWLPSRSGLGKILSNIAKYCHARWTDKYNKISLDQNFNYGSLHELFGNGPISVLGLGQYQGPDVQTNFFWTPCHLRFLGKDLTPPNSGSFCIYGDESGLGAWPASGSRANFFGTSCHLRFLDLLPSLMSKLALGGVRLVALNCSAQNTTLIVFILFLQESYTEKIKQNSYSTLKALILRSTAKLCSLL